jgi:rfaE bifunctional protein nucleotidyltransferase chain/domain
MIDTIMQKIKSLAGSRDQVEKWRSEHQKIVWTNGVFDLLHPGHIRYLCAARDLGDRLVVGINSDASVYRLKGPGRPVNPQDARLLQMAALQMTDLVLLFEEDTPLQCILALRPDVIVKGGDYRPEEVVGGREAASWGGVVVIIPFEAGHSSSGIIKKIKRQSHED